MHFKVIIQGERDEFGKPETLRRLFSSPPVVIPEANHFFSGRLDSMAEALERWLASPPWLDSPAAPR
jgi:alpha/beta superfamily hydrolase